MGKYIWPSNSAKAARWYLQLFKELSKEMTLDNFITALGKDAPPRKSAYTRLQRLRSQNLLDRYGQGQHAVYRINRNGLALLAKLELFDIKLPKNWDRLWRIVLFDVPDASRTSRTQIGRLLKELCFIQLQLSA